MINKKKINKQPEERRSTGLDYSSGAAENPDSRLTPRLVGCLSVRVAVAVAEGFEPSKALALHAFEVWGQVKS